MILGSHDSMSYLKPKGIFSRIFRWTAQCQDVDIRTQLDRGLRYFDLRLKWTTKDQIDPVFGHGLACYEGPSVREVFQLLNNYTKKTRPIYVRVVLETFTKHKKWQLEKFKSFISEIMDQWPGLRYQIIIKNPWKVIHDDFKKQVKEIQSSPKTLIQVLKGPRRLKLESQPDPEIYEDSNLIIAGDFIL